MVDAVADVQMENARENMARSAVLRRLRFNDRLFRG